jgi:hypothetical protein
LAKRSQRENFDRLLLDATDEALSSLGEDAKVSIYSHFEDLFKIRKQEIPSKLNDFSNALEQIFGLGTRHLEVLFMKNLHAKVGGLYKWEGPRWLVPEMKFLEYVKLMKLCYGDQGRIGEVEFLIAVEEKQEQEVWIDAEEKQEQHV